jgi:hypothetical protein
VVQSPGQAALQTTRRLPRRMATPTTRRTIDVRDLSTRVDVRNPYTLYRCTWGLLSGQITDVVILQEAFGVEAVPDLRESIGGVFAGLLQQDFGASWMFIHPL